MGRADPTPAIVRDYTDADADATVMSTPTDNVSHQPGWGESGYRIEVVDYQCPAEYCGFDSMVRRHDVSPESRDEVRYWCLNPNCAHFVKDHLSHACHGNYPQRVVTEPAVTE